MQESLVFLILGVGRLREDQLIYVETRENVFFIIWDLSVDHIDTEFLSFSGFIVPSVEMWR